MIRNMMKTAVCTVVFNVDEIEDGIAFRELIFEEMRRLGGNIAERIPRWVFVNETGEIVISLELDETLAQVMDELTDSDDFLNRILWLCEHNNELESGDIYVPYIIDTELEEHYGELADKLFKEYCEILGISPVKARLTMPSFDLNEDRYFWLRDKLIELRGERVV